MMNYTGVSIYPTSDGIERKKIDANKPDAGNLANNQNNAMPSSLGNPSPFQIYQTPSQDHSTFQFRDPLSPPRTEVPQSPKQQVTPLGLLPANMAQLVNANLEKMAGQIMSFFKANQKEKPSEEEKLNRQLNDAFGAGLLGEVVKVEEAAKGQMGDGGDQ